MVGSAMVAGSKRELQKILSSDFRGLVVSMIHKFEQADADLCPRSDVVVLVDEAQDLPDDELTALCSIIHAANQRQDRLVLALAGLPSLPRKLAEAKSYVERLFSYHAVGELSDEDAAAALVTPAEVVERAADRGAAEAVADLLTGDPIQKGPGE